ncbi:MAG: hypothetical protein NW237_14135 [Cyanobacteriota bacterium]|nr:hypothetical protein [Cyanobacteriota bacterium]
MEIFIDKYPSLIEIEQALAELLKVDISQVAATLSFSEYLKTNKIIPPVVCEIKMVSGNFSCCVYLHLPIEKNKEKVLEVIGGLCEILNCRAMISYRVGNSGVKMYLFLSRREYYRIAIMDDEEYSIWQQVLEILIETPPIALDLKNILSESMCLPKDNFFHEDDWHKTLLSRKVIYSYYNSHQKSSGNLCLYIPTNHRFLNPYNEMEVAKNISRKIQCRIAIQDLSINENERLCFDPLVNSITVIPLSEITGQ